ncbi:MAG: hypothetical protein RL092_1933, partial [Bacteroidota bacterium]
MISFNFFCRCTLTIVCFVCFASVSSGQSKKEQIEVLNKRLDSLQKVNSMQLSIINQSSTRINELNDNLTNSKKNVEGLQTQLQDRTSEIYLQSTEIQRLKSEIKLKTDSIRLLTWDRPYLHPIDSLRWWYGEKEVVWLRPIDQVLNYLGEYQSEDVCVMEMPRFTDKVGPRMAVSITAFNEYRNSCEGDVKNKYYLELKFCE